MLLEELKAGRDEREQRTGATGKNNGKEQQKTAGENQVQGGPCQPP
jgi:hypothetical protein